MVRIGAHVSGGVGLAAARAAELGCDCLQIFTASPRQWQASPVPADKAAAMIAQRRQHALGPLVVHANYLINVAGDNPEFRARSRAALRGELERARAVEADYLVLHPGSGTLDRCIAGLRAAAEGFDWGSLRLLIENTAGGGHHLGGSFASVAAILDALPELPLGACIDTCHAWVAGYDLVNESGFAATLLELDATVGLARVPVFHVNDAKAERGSHRDRHEHIGAGTLGSGVFQRLLNHVKLQGKAFILETPVDDPADQARDLAALRALLPKAKAKTKRV